MKKIKILASAIIAVVVLTGCGYDTGEVVYDGRFVDVGELGAYDVLRDVNTGCTYLESKTDADMLPLYDKEGKVKGCGEEVKIGEY